MSQIISPEVEDPLLAEIERLENLDLVYEDGVPLDTPWHRFEIDLLSQLVVRAMAGRGREDYYTGGNMFIYFSLEQAELIRTAPPHEYRHVAGPDFFFVDRVPNRDRKAWVAWKEQGRYPDVIGELLSPSTAHVDRTRKKELYERTFRTPEYFLYDPDRDQLDAFRLGVRGAYEPIPPDPHGRVWSEPLGLWLGRWRGTHMRLEATWLRFFDADGRLIPTDGEVAGAERQRADAERQRADAAEAEVARLRAALEKR